MDTSETENEKRLMQNAKIDYIDRVLKQLEQSNCLITIWKTILPKIFCFWRHVSNL